MTSVLVKLDEIQNEIKYQNTIIISTFICWSLGFLSLLNIFFQMHS